MEKRKPHFELAVVKTLINAGKVKATASGDAVYVKLTVIDDVLIVSFKEL